MVARVLLPVDDREHARRACNLAVELFPGDQLVLVLVHVVNPADAGYSPEGAVSGIGEDWYERQQDDAAALFDDIEAHVRAQVDDVEFERHIEVGRPARSIVRYVEEGDADHIVMGSHGRRGVSRLLLGSVAESVVRRSPVPVTVVQ